MSPSQGRSLSCLETGMKCLCSSQLNHCIFLHDLNLENEHSLLWCSLWDRKNLCWDRDSGAWDSAFDPVKILEGRNYQELRCESEPRGGKMEKHRWLSQKMSFHKRQKLFCSSPIRFGIQYFPLWVNMHKSIYIKHVFLLRCIRGLTDPAKTKDTRHPGLPVLRTVHEAP